MEAVIVPCVTQKIWGREPTRGPTPARDAYVEPRFRSWVAVAEESRLPWFILSSKYGLIRPETEISNYNRPSGDARRDPKFIAMVARQAREFGLSAEGVTVLDWEQFQAILAAAFGVPQDLVALRKTGVR